MKSWIRRFALLAVMGSIVGGVVMAGCSSSEPPADENATTTPADPAAPPADTPAPPADAPAPPPAP